MQGELEAEYPLLRIQLLGINEKGQEAGNANTTNGRDIPWLQDVDADSNGRADVATDLWHVTFRDVVILDGNNVKVGVYNLSEHNLAEGENYSELKEMLLDAAMTSQKPWRNAGEPHDVDDDGLVAPLDVLLIINVLNDVGPYELPRPTAAETPPPFYDTNGDGWIAPSDALQVINYLNDLVPAEAEGESAPAVQLLEIQPIVATSSEPVSVAGGKAATTDAETTPAVDDAVRTESIDRVIAEEDIERSPWFQQDAAESDWLDSLAIGRPLELL